MTQTLPARDVFAADFARVRESGPAWLQSLRREAFSRFEQHGFPTIREEAWRQTNLAPLAQLALRPAQAPAKIGDVPEDFLLDELAGPRIAFVNGRHDANLSRTGTAQKGLTIARLSEAFESHRALVEAHFAKIVSHEFVLAALNTALVSDGVFVHVAKSVVLEHPIHILFLNVPGAEPAATHPRVLFVIEDEAQAKLIETHAGIGSGVHFSDVVTEISAGESSFVRHLKIQRETPESYHIATLGAELARAANFTTQTVNLGGLLTRNDLVAVLDGEGIECNLHGLTLVGGKQHVDNHTRLEHAKPNCFSRQFYKAVLDDKATSVFTGRIHVHPDAQKTDAIQSNRSLLLSKDATTHAQPQLEIFADDVRCTHGATIGAIDDEAIFYLRSRGISQAEARGLLTYAFANEIIERIEIEPLRARLERLIYDRFEGEFHQWAPKA